MADVQMHHPRSSQNITRADDSAPIYETQGWLVGTAPDPGDGGGGDGGGDGDGDGGGDEQGPPSPPIHVHP